MQLKKGIKDLVAEAEAQVTTISTEDAIRCHGDDDVVFVDVREQSERDLGYIPGSVHAPRGVLEFIADPDGPMHNPALASGRRLVVYCASGGRSVLAAKTLRDMGLAEVANLVGGFQAWCQGGGDVAD